MNEKIKYICRCCGKVHEHLPAIVYDAPTYYHLLSDKVKQETAILDQEVCVINHPDQTDRFIKGTLTLKVEGGDEDLEYGIWASVSELSFYNYIQNFGNPQHKARYCGWLSNDLPEYESFESIPILVLTRPKGQRPEIIPQPNYDHPLVHDFYRGISRAEAEKRISNIHKLISETSPWTQAVHIQ